MSDLPQEFITDILSRLPVKSLLRFRCVSKPWCVLVDSPDFAKIHLKQSIKTRTNLNLMFGGGNAFFSADFDFDYDNDDKPRNVLKLDNPLPSVYGTGIMGTCNGLIGLSITASGVEKLALWNPWTWKYKIIPLGADHFTLAFHRRWCVEDFGYDHVHDDYKIVRVLQGCDQNLALVDSKIHVYSLKSGSWRMVREFPYYLCYRLHHSACVGGALHWVVSDVPEAVDEFLIVAFDLETEEHRFVPQPEYLAETCYSLNLTVLGGCLCVICHDHRFGIDVWVMEEYGVKESWTILFSLPHSSLGREFPIMNVRPIAYSKGGLEVLLYHDGKLSWYDLESKTIKRIRVDNVPEGFHANVCFASLVQPGGFGASGSGSKKKEADGKKKKDDFLSKGFKLKL